MVLWRPIDCSISNDLQKKKKWSAYSPQACPERTNLCRFGSVLYSSMASLSFVEWVTGNDGAMMIMPMIGLVHKGAELGLLPFAPSSLTWCLLLSLGFRFLDGVLLVLFVVLGLIILLPGNGHLDLRLGREQTQRAKDGWTIVCIYICQLQKNWKYDESRWPREQWGRQIIQLWCLQ